MTGHVSTSRAPGPRESEFQKAVLDLARIRGWMVAHFGMLKVDRRAGPRYLTPVKADGKGFPDLVLVKPGVGCLFRELKTTSGALSENQKAWLHALNASGMDAGVWTPKDWTRIAEELGAI